MLDSLGDGEDDDEEESVSDDARDQEIFEYVDEDELEQLKKEAAQFCPVLLDEIDCFSSENSEKLQLLVRQQQHALILSAKIGQTLVYRTDNLMAKNKTLECQLETQTEQVRQLEYEKKKLHDDLRSRLYGDDEDGGDQKDESSLKKSSNCCCCCDDDQSDVMRNKIQKLVDDNLKKSSEISRLNSLLESERMSAREDCAECWRRLDHAEADIRQLRDKVNSKQRKLEQMEEELNRSNNDVRCLASLLTKADAELQVQLDAYTKEKSFLQFKYEEATSRCDEYIALYTELKAENAGLLQRLKHRERSKLMSQQGQMSVAQELDMTDSCPSSRRRGQMLVPQELDMTDSCPSSRRCSPMSITQEFDMLDSCPSSRRGLPLVVDRSSDHSLQALTSYAHASPSSFHAQSQQEDRTCSHWTSSDETELIHARLFSVDDSLREKFRSVLGQPGRPGSHDLDVALLRLSIHDGNGHILVGYSANYSSLWNRTRQPALRNTHLTSDAGRKSVDSGYSGKETSVSKKFQINKFQNGSWILRSWRRLSTPHLGTLLELQEGIVVRYSVDVTLTDRSASTPFCSCHRTRMSSTPSSVDFKESASISTSEDDFDAASIASGAVSDIEDDSIY